MQHGLQYQSDIATAAAEDTTAYAPDDAADNAPADANTASQATSDAWSANHAINIRLTIPLPFTRCYLAILGGKERRNPDRRAEERRKNPLATKRNIIFLSILGLITGMALFTVIQYAARFVLEKIGAF